jgi:hypothetical protein
VDAIERAAEIESARAERIARAAGHHARQIWLTFDHLRRWEPVRPFLHARDALGAGPGKSVAADADTVAHRFAATQHEVKIRIGGINDDCAGRLFGREIDQLLLEVRRQFLRLSRLRLILRRQGHNAVAGAIGRPRRL